jgi:polyhydroxyalkanoate synthesis repressor PhaR
MTHCGKTKNCASQQSPEKRLPQTMILIKKYSNRRLYDTTASAYVNLQQIAQRIREGHRIKVVDVKEGDDLTQQVLLQILLEHQGGIELLPAGLLHRIIRSTSDNPMQRLALQQLASGMSLLDQQLSAFEKQTGWTAGEEPHPPEPSPAEPVRATAPPVAADRSQVPSPDRPPKGTDPELDALRARLAALENRLTT